MIPRLLRYAGLAAYINGAVGVLGALLLITFFVVGQPFGTLNDLTALPWSLAMIPVMFGLYRYNSSRAQALDLFGLIAGMLGVLAVFIFQSLLILRVITFSQELPYINAAYGLIGLWLIVVNRRTHPDPIASRGLARLGLVIGALSVAGNILSWLGGLPTNGVGAAFNFSTMSPITLFGYTLLFIAYLLQPIWALWLGRTLLSRRAVHASFGQ